MTRPRERSADACPAPAGRSHLLLAILALLVGSAAAVLPATAAGAATSATPLRVTISTLEPATVPTKGPMTISGTVTNTSDQTWTALQAYMLTSPSPITTSSGLAAAVRSDPAVQVGGRIATTGLYDDIGDLAPGQSTSYTLSVPRSQLQISGAPGVYWFGVHVLGTVNGLRDNTADGRARTFVPLLPSSAKSTRLALVIPIKQGVRRSRFGTLLNPRFWRNELSPDGRLGRLLALSDTETSPLTRPITWVVDPAVLDAARSLAAGNPPFATGPPADASGASASPSPSSSPSASPSGGPSSPPTETERVARGWLADFHRQAATHELQVLPYGDLDVASTLLHDQPGLLARATRLSTATMSALGLTSGSIVAPGDGYLTGRAIDQIPPTSSVLVSGSSMPSVTGSAVHTDAGTKVLLGDGAAEAGGPRPSPRFSALALRQRILAEAALHAMSAYRGAALVISLPQHWDPGAAWPDADFWGGLDQPWLQLVGLSQVGTNGGGHVTPTTPPATATRPVPSSNLDTTQDLIRTGSIFDTLLARNSTIGDQVSKTALLASSMAARRHPTDALVRARRTITFFNRQMAQVTIDGPPFVMMSSTEGPIQISLVNGLDEPVTVGLRAHVLDGGIRIRGGAPITIGPDSRAAVRLTAQGGHLGVHPVTVVATDSAGRPIGAQTQFSIRTSQVGEVIWIIMAVAAALLFGAIAVRLTRRVMRRTRGAR